MKKLLQRVFGAVVSAALLVTSGMTALALEPGHSHGGGTAITTTPDPAYTITLTHSDEKTEFDGTNSHYGAYQIFSGTVKGSTLNISGSDNAKIPIADIKWGNAFCSAEDTDLDPTTDDDGRTNILKFVYALYNAPKGSYSYAFDVFGEDFNKFITAESGTKLSSDYTDGGDVTFTLDGEKVTAISNLGNVKYDKLAVAVSDVLAQPAHIDNHEWLQAFTDILGGYGQGESGYLNEGYVNRFYDGKINDDDNKKYEIKVPAGYYMVRDLSGFNGETDKSYSARMLFVANNVNQVLKEDIPTLDKEIVRDDNKEYKTEAAGVGDEVNFRLTGQLPSNYDQYTLGYQFTFTDELSKGLTLKGEYERPIADSLDYNGLTDTGFEVKVKGVYDTSDSKWYPDLELKITPDCLTSTHTHTHATPSGDAYIATVKEKGGVQTLTVEFPCLKEIKITGGDGHGGTASDEYILAANSEYKSEIRIYYTAVVDEDAVVSPAVTTGSEPDISTELNGNTNKAILTYSDNPQSYGDTDKTTEEKATVYTFGLDITKVDAADFLKNAENPEAAGLSGAKFILVRPTATANEYEIAKFVTVAATTTGTDPFKGEKYYSIDSWEKLGTLNSDTTLEKLFNTFVTGKTKTDYELETYSDTDEKGHLNISGLNDGIIYTMVETATPADYAKINPFTIKLTANQDENTKEYDGKLSGATSEQNILPDTSFSFDRPVEITDIFDTTEEDGSANMLVANFKYVDLPSTGGVGTYWFYILGAGGLTMSFVLFRLSRKKIVQ